MTLDNDYPNNWDQIRKKVYRRDGFKCQNCGARGGSGGDTELHAHHIVPKSKGGTHDPSNLKTVCKKCHNSIHGSSLAPTAQTKSKENKRSHFEKSARRQTQMAFSGCPLCDSSLFSVKDDNPHVIDCSDCGTAFRYLGGKAEIISLNDEYLKSDSHIHSQVLMEYDLPPSVWSQFSKIDNIQSLNLERVEMDAKSLDSRETAIVIVSIAIASSLFIYLTYRMNIIIGIIMGPGIGLLSILVLENIFTNGAQIDITNYSN